MDFKKGDQVRMLPSGALAVISEVRTGSKYTTYGVEFMGQMIWASADAYELATEPTPAPDANTPAGEGVADDKRLHWWDVLGQRNITAEEMQPRIDLKPETLERWPRLWRESYLTEYNGNTGTDDMRYDMLDALDVIATLQTELAAAQALAVTNAALLANAQSELDARLRELTALEGERNRLRGALRPFVREWVAYQDYAKKNGVQVGVRVGNYLTNYRDLDIIMDACERAAKALAASAGEGNTPIEPAKFEVGEWVEVRQPDGRPFADRMLVYEVYEDLGWRYLLKNSESDPVPGTVAPESNLRKIES